ncbi:MAG TPA: DUF6382 domain-containing protein [Bacillota bacterium]|nr:DUF6382 domain-containing protein [Bacillota bacterium]
MKILGFDWKYVTSSGRRYLVLSQETTGPCPLIRYQVEMLTNNRIPGLARVEIRRKDLQLRLFYNVNGLVSLADYIAATQPEFKQLAELLLKVIQPLRGCKNYFLGEQNFVIDQHYIFIEPTTREIFLIYLPVAIKQDMSSCYYQLLSEIASSCPWQRFPLNPLVVREVTGEEQLNLAGLMRLVQSLNPAAQEIKVRPPINLVTATRPAAIAKMEALEPALRVKVRDNPMVSTFLRLLTGKNPPAKGQAPGGDSNQGHRGKPIVIVDDAHNPAK